MTLPNLNDLDLTADSPDNATAAPDSPALQSVSKLVAEWDVLKGDLIKIALWETQRKARIKEIEEAALPSAMEQAGVPAFTTPSGRSVVVDEIVKGGIPAISTIEKAKGAERSALEARRVEALRVIAEKWPGLIKTEVSMSLGKGETELATRIVKLLRIQFDISAAVDETVNHNSLNSHFRELKEAGKLGEIPPEPFALYIGPFAKIK